MSTSMLTIVNFDNDRSKMIQRGEHLLLKGRHEEDGGGVKGREGGEDGRVE